jgi:hypothetical protein
MNYRRFYECPDATYETVKAAYKGHKLVKKEEKTKPKANFTSVPIPVNMRNNQQFYDDMIAFFDGNEDLAKMIMA